MGRRSEQGGDTWAASLASRYCMRYPKAEWSWRTSCKRWVHNDPFFCPTCSHPDRLWKSTPLLALTPRAVSLAQVHRTLCSLILRLCDKICERPLSALVSPSRLGLRERGSRRHVLTCLDPPLFQTSQERHVSSFSPWTRQHWSSVDLLLQRKFLLRQTAELCLLPAQLLPASTCRPPLLKLLHEFVKVVLCLSRPLPNNPKLKVDRDFKVCWIFCFGLKVLNKSIYSMPWVRCAFGNVFFLSIISILLSSILEHNPCIFLVALDSRFVFYCYTSLFSLKWQLWKTERNNFDLVFALESQ